MRIPSPQPCSCTCSDPWTPKFSSACRYETVSMACVAVLEAVCDDLRTPLVEDSTPLETRYHSLIVAKSSNGKILRCLSLTRLRTRSSSSCVCSKVGTVLKHNFIQSSKYITMKSQVHFLPRYHHASACLAGYKPGYDVNSVLEYKAADAATPCKAGDKSINVRTPGYAMLLILSVCDVYDPARPSVS
jgi:hypothetical protein